MGKSTVRDFATDDEFSKSAQADEFWGMFYRAAFANFVSMSGINNNIETQKRGIDRVVNLTDGKVLIDEKLRRTFYSDFFLEYESSDVGHKPGWLNKDLDIDYIAYGWLSVRKGYLLEWTSLVRAWHTYGLNWKNQYPKKQSQNRDYITWGVCVPTQVICDIVDVQFVNLKEPIRLDYQLALF